MENPVKKPNITCDLVFITPKLAAEFLEGNTGNRSKRRWWVEAMASAMRRGEWITTHQGIAITKTGRVLDGQHRLEAIISNGSGVWMMVTKGITDEAFKVIDNGIKRSVADLSGLPKRLAESCRFIGTLLFGASVSTQQIIDIANTGPNDIHEELIETCGSVRKYYTSAPIRSAATALVMDGFNKNEVFRIYTDMALERFSDLPLSAQALIRQVNSSKATANNSFDTLARGLKVLNPDNKDLTIIKCSESDIQSSKAYVRSVFQKALATE